MTTPMLVASARALTPIANRRDDDNDHPDDGHDTGNDPSQHQLEAANARGWIQLDLTPLPET